VLRSDAGALGLNRHVLGVAAAIDQSDEVFQRPAFAGADFPAASMTPAAAALEHADADAWRRRHIVSRADP